MHVARYALVVFLIVAALIGTQLLVTDVGSGVSEEWSDPVTVDRVDDRRVDELAVDDDGDAATIAWIVEGSDEWIVKVAPLRTDGGAITAGDPQVIHRADAELDHVAVDRDDDGWTVAWRRADDGGFSVVRTDGEIRTFRTDRRIRYPSVEATDDGVVLAWSEQRESEYRLHHGVLETGDLRATATGYVTNGRHSPSIDGDGARIAVAWLDPEERSATVATGTVDEDGLDLERAIAVGQAREHPEYVRAGYNVDVALDSGAVHVAWFDQFYTMYGTANSDGETTATRISTGERPAVAASHDDYLLGWVARDQTGNAYDVWYDGTIAGERVGGPVSLSAASSLNARPVFAPDPGFVWTERGDGVDVRASARLEEPRNALFHRIANSPTELLFYSVATLAMSAVVTAIMPWIAVSFLGLFLVTSGAVSKRLVGLAATTGRLGDRAAVYHRLEGVPTLAWGGLFAAVSTGLLYWMIVTGTSTEFLTFERPIAISVAAFVVSVAAAVLERNRCLGSIWYFGALFSFVQTAMLWVTLLPRYF